MRLDTLPASMVILGGGYVAVELAHVFSSLGVEIQIVERGSSLLETLDAEISKRFTAQASARWDVHLDVRVTEVIRQKDGIVVVARRWHASGRGTVVGGRGPPA